MQTPGRPPGTSRPAYQEILPLRTNHIDSVALIANGVPADYDPQATAAAYRALLPA